MDKHKLTKQQLDYKEQQMIIGSEYESLVKSKGWEYTKAWYQTQLSDFINRIMSEDSRPISDFENARQQLIGFKRYLSHVEGAIKILEDERTKKS